MTETAERDDGLSRLEAQLLVALAEREQCNTDDQSRALEKQRPKNAFTGNVRKIATFERWEVTESELDVALQNLNSRKFIITDLDLTRPDFAKARVRLSAEGYASAARIFRTYDPADEKSFKRDMTFEDSGAGQILVDFLGERLLIGCVEGEEAKAIRRLEHFEINTGEVMKAVAGVDLHRAILMSAIISQERIEELEERARVGELAVEELVTLGHSTPAYHQAIAALDNLIAAVQRSNVYREQDPQDQERRLAELEAGRHLLKSKTASLVSLRTALIAVVTYLALKFVDAPIGEAATAAWNALKAILPHA